MSTLAIYSDVHQHVKPEPRSPISIRVAVPGKADLSFIDALQKKHNKAVGFMPLNQLEKRIAAGQVLIAETCSPLSLGEGSGVRADSEASGDRAHPHQLPGGPLPGGEGIARIGYIIFADKYFKREDLGIVYQLNVVPGRQRGLVGAALVKAAFEACPWGVKLFCCWCAQDLPACHFWEALGFVPIACRAGSRGKAQGGTRKEARMQIFWQRRIREGDDRTPYWYPTETSGGAMKENRIVLPILSGAHWSDAMPMVLPGAQQSDAAKALDSDLPKIRKPRAPKPKAAAVRSDSISMGGLRFVPGKAAPAAVEPKTDKPKSPRIRQKNDPKFIKAARELRDRYLEEVNSGHGRFLLSATGKYDVSRRIAPAPGNGDAPMSLTRLRLTEAA